MTAFLDAMRNKDREALLSLFSRRSSWSYISTIAEPSVPTLVSFSALKADFDSRTGWYEVLVEADGEDCFRDWVVNTSTADWKQTKSHRFVRQRHGGRDTVYVEWRLEESVWVVAAIAEPAA